MMSREVEGVAWFSLCSGAVFVALQVMKALRGPEAVASSSGSRNHHTSYDQLIGNTPLIKLVKLSQITGRNIYVKMESNNPAGTGKDRAVQFMLDTFEKSGLLKPGMDVVEGTSGSTGIALAYQCNARGYKLHIVMPDDQAMEKRQLLKNLGAEVVVVPSCSIASKDHYVNTARRLAEQLNGVFVNQFENVANYQVHYEVTGPEIWNQLHGEIDGFIMSSGTGGTIAGVSRFLKEKNPKVKVILADPPGSSLYHKVMHNVCYTKQQSERTIRKHRYDSIVEGVGLDRLTANFKQAKIDHAYSILDQEFVNVAHWLIRNEGLFIGSSSALNITATLKSLEHFPPGSNVVTVICDNGSRHVSRFYNAEALSKYQLKLPYLDNDGNPLERPLVDDQLDKFVRSLFERCECTKQ